MINKHVATFIGRAAAGAAGILTAKYLESKESRERLISNIRDINDEIERKIDSSINSGIEEAKTVYRQLKEKF